MEIRLARDEAGEAEIFRSLQGEGPMAGRVRTFVRLAGCNLHCVWCDTAYTWNWIGSDFRHVRDAPDAPHKFDPAREVVKLPVEEAARRAGALGGEGVVITGGEPLMQGEAAAELAARLKKAAPDLRIEIETNASIAPSPRLAVLTDLFVASPKLAHAGNEAAVALKPAALAALVELGERAVFKFVARNAADVAEAAALAAAHAMAPGRVYIMPEGADAASLAARGPELAAAALAHGFNYSDRLHVHLFGARRGV